MLFATCLTFSTFIHYIDIIYIDVFLTSKGFFVFGT